MNTIMKAVVAAATAVAVGLPAAAAPGDCRLLRAADTPDAADDVSVCRQDTWFHQAQGKAGNAAALGQGNSPSWDTTYPTASVTSGAGGGYVASGAFDQVVAAHDPRGTVRFEGTYTGTLGNLAVTLYAFVPGRQGTPNPALNYQLTIDGEQIYGSGAAERPRTVAAARRS